MRVVLLLDGLRMFVVQGVVEECQELEQELQQLTQNGDVEELSDEGVSSARVADIANSSNLGLGESECLACCEADENLTFCTDDRRARNVATALLGADRVVGCEDLLLKCVRQNLLNALDAYTAHELMRRRGAFLPERPREFFITVE